MSSQARAPKPGDTPSAHFEVEAERERAAERREQRLDEVGPEDGGANLGRPVLQPDHEAETFLALLDLCGDQVGGALQTEGDAPAQPSAGACGRFGGRNRGHQDAVARESERQLALRGGQ